MTDLIPWVLGVDPGNPSGWALLSPLGILVKWGALGGPRKHVDGEGVAECLQECERLTTGNLRPLLAIEGQFVLDGGGKGEKNHCKSLSTLKTAKVAGIWIGVAQFLGWQVMDDIQPSTWRSAVWGGRWTTEQAKRHAVEMCLLAWGVRILSTHHHTAEAAWIAEYARKQTQFEQLKLGGK